MMHGAQLTKRESEIAELFAWGASKKDVASRLFISERTVENHTRNIYEKTGCAKVNELSAWWFCTHFHISFDLSPLKRNIIAAFLLMIVLPQVFQYDNGMMRTFRTKTAKTASVRTARRKGEQDGATAEITF